MMQVVNKRQYFSFTNNFLRNNLQQATLRQDLPPQSTEVKNAWSYTSTVLYVFMA
jgi:hypothetical protein